MGAIVGDNALEQAPRSESRAEEARRRTRILGDGQTLSGNTSEWMHQFVENFPPQRFNTPPPPRSLPRTLNVTTTDGENIINLERYQLSGPRSRSPRLPLTTPTVGAGSNYRVPSPPPELARLARITNVQSTAEQLTPSRRFTRSSFTPTIGPPRAQPTSNAPDAFEIESERRFNDSRNLDEYFFPLRVSATPPQSSHQDDRRVTFNDQSTTIQIPTFNPDDTDTTQAAATNQPSSSQQQPTLRRSSRSRGNPEYNEDKIAQNVFGDI